MPPAGTSSLALPLGEIDFTILDHAIRIGVKLPLKIDLHIPKARSKDNR